jgi:hypothetical protein
MFERNYVEIHTVFIRLGIFNQSIQLEKQFIHEGNDLHYAFISEFIENAEQLN